MSHVTYQDGRSGRVVEERRDLESALLARVRVRLQIPLDVDVPMNARLVDLLAFSPIGTSSLDLFEAFAKAIVDLDGHLDAELPVFTVMDEAAAVCHKIVQRAPAPPGSRDALNR